VLEEALIRNFLYDANQSLTPERNHSTQKKIKLKTLSDLG
jgi:hypothetical protein